MEYKNLNKEDFKGISNKEKNMDKENIILMIIQYCLEILIIINYKEK